MLATNTQVWLLSSADRQVLESWLVEFDRSWAEDRLPARVRELPPPGSSLRLPALIELVKIDLERQWQRGRRVSLEEYLQAYPELGTPESVPTDLIQIEYAMCQQFGAPADLAEFARRFPRQADELRLLVEETLTGSSAAPPGKGTPRAAPSTHPSGRRASGPASLPEQFGRYRILKCLGQGGMGAVYLAHDTQLERSVALKVSHFAPEDGPEILQRFYREARAAATLLHPNLCPVHDVGAIGDVHYLTMAYLEGRPLSERLAASPPLSPKEAVTIVRKVALALELAHRRGIIHRDLKPSNIMLTEAGEPVVMDFGLARQMDKEESRLTQHGAVLGTPAYMSPEQVNGDVQAMGPACDIYSLGVILYELLTGHRPFEGPMMAVLGQILTGPPEPPSKLRPGLDPRLEAVCLRAMAKKIDDRYATMGELAAVLADILDNPMPEAGVREHGGAAGLERVSDPGTLTPTEVGGGPFRERPAAAGEANVPAGPPSRPLAADRRRLPTLPWKVVAAAGAAAVLLLGVVIVIKTKQGTIRLELDDSNPIIEVNGKVVSGEPAAGQAPPRPMGEGVDPAVIRSQTGKQGTDPELATLEGHKDFVRVVAFSPDGQTLVSAGKDGTVRLWDVATAKERAVLTGHKSEVEELAFAPDGKTLASVGSDGTLRLWDLAQRAERVGARNEKQRLHAVVFAPDGQTLVTGSGAGVLKIWNAATGMEVAPCKGHSASIPQRSLAFSPDGKVLASGSEDGTVRLWEPGTGKRQATWQGHREVRAVQFTPDGKLLLAIDRDYLRIWDTAKGEQRASLPGAKFGALQQALAVSPDGRRVAAGGGSLSGGGWVLWETTSGRELVRTAGAHDYIVEAVAFSPDSKLLATTGDVCVKLWDVANGKELANLQEHVKRVHRVVFSPDGRLLASASDDGTVKLWDVARAVNKAPAQPPAGKGDSK